MQRAARLQIIGPLVLLAILLGADSAAYALALKPSSGWLWYLNFEVFGIFRKGRILLGEYGNIPFALAMLAMPLVLLGFIGVSFRRKLALATASNLSLLYVGFLVLGYQNWHMKAKVMAASLAPVFVPNTNELSWFFFLGSATLVSAAASHVLYIRALRAGR